MKTQETQKHVQKLATISGFREDTIRKLVDPLAGTIKCKTCEFMPDSSLSPKRAMRSLAMHYARVHGNNKGDPNKRKRGKKAIPTTDVQETKARQHLNYCPHCGVPLRAVQVALNL